MDTVAVTGASGGLGRALLDRLIGRVRIRALFRAEGGLVEEWRRQGCAAILGDLADEAALDALVAGASVVYHCAAMVSGPYADSRAVNVDGTRRVAAAAARAGCRRFIHVSSVAVYAGLDAQDIEITEDTATPRPADLAAYPVSKLEAEDVVRDVAAGTGLEYTILRPTCIYGPHTRSYTRVPLELMRRGLPVMVGDGLASIDAVYVDDIASAMIAAAAAPSAANGTFILGHESVGIREFFGWYERMLDRRARRLPAGLVQALVRALSASRGTRPAQVRNGLRFLLRGSQSRCTYSSARARASFGYAPAVTLPPGMLATELWAQEQGLTHPRAVTLPGYGPLPFRPLAVCHPRSEAELAAAVQVAARAGVAVRAIGSLHSLSRVPEAPGVCLILDGYTGLEHVDGPLVTVRAGTILRVLHQALADRGLALPASGNIAAQTVAGAVSTGTHGGSLHVGALSDYVEAVRLVAPDGTVDVVDRAHPAFDAAVVSLGLLGIVSAVTFRCCAAFRLESRAVVVPAGEALARFETVHRTHQYVDMLYHPATDDVEILTVDGCADAQPATVAPWDPAAAVPGRAARAIRAAVVAALKLAARGLATLPLVGLQRRLTRRSVGRSYTPAAGRSDLVLAFGDRDTAIRTPNVVRDMELAVPFDRAVAALETLRELFRHERPPLLPIHIRCSPASRQWLSPAFGRDVVWLEFWASPGADEYFRRIHEVLAPFDYRFHWGKEGHAGPDYIAHQYPRWQDFERLRVARDPGGRLLNGYLAGYFGVSTAQPTSTPARATVSR